VLALLVRLRLVEHPLQPIEDDLEPEVEVSLGVVANPHRVRRHPTQVRVLRGRKASARTRTQSASPAAEHADSAEGHQV
jgi:hypothetical protein